MVNKLITLTNSQEISVTEDTKYIVDVKDYNGEPVSINLLFEKQGITAELIALYKLGTGDILDLTTIATHKVPNTSCQTHVRGVLLDGARSSYAGKIIIEKPAQQTSSFLDDSVLVIGENTKNRSDPILEIEADDVKASHGATTGRIDESILYYLQSRGLNRTEAENLVVEGFFESLLGTIDDIEVRDKVKAKLL